MRPAVALACLAAVGCSSPVGVPDDAPPRWDASREQACPARDAARDDAALDAAPPPERTCCDEAICAAVGQRCDTMTCRCERVPCTVEGGPCDAPGLPPPWDDLSICAASSAGLFCHVAVRTGEECPSAIREGRGLADGRVVCGSNACSVFHDDCEPGVACTSGWPGAPICRGPARSVPEGTPCSGGPDPVECGELACVDYACERPSCGLSSGAPSCSPDQTCRFLDELGMVGVCRTRCDPFDLDGCAPDRVCREDPGAGTGLCMPSAWSFPTLPRLGERCEPACASALTCVLNGDSTPIGNPTGTCMERCDPYETDPAALSACPAHQSCDPIERVCVTPCDPFRTDAQCDAGLRCAVSIDGCEVRGACLPGSGALGARGTACYPFCGSGLVCSTGPSASCRAPCRPSAPTGSERGCEPGERCFPFYDGPAPTDVGFCQEPCDPGGSDCDPGVWCEPRELDAASGRWVGTCGPQR